ncbi:hypothetical protein TPA0910_62040 [Streptomyces hygroscopicus subsp. sporocinereus]|uniref:Uncharacterized protein n=1 Tax=Streptomyces hygroscopicus TaxID=1912 RepID=A0ABQ3U8N9_STRHY|nr:hypothetical protein TPA0910_62040 [Streptomyces hygroscopicus]
MGGWGGCGICAYLSGVHRPVGLLPRHPVGGAGRKGATWSRIPLCDGIRAGILCTTGRLDFPRGRRVRTASRHGEVSDSLECADGPALAVLMVIRLGARGGEPEQGPPASQKGKAEQSDDSSDRQQIGLAKNFKGVRPHQEAL